MTHHKLSFSLRLQSEEERMPGTTSAKEACHGHKVKNSEEEGNVWGLLGELSLLVNYPAFLISQSVSINICAMIALNSAHTAIFRWVPEPFAQMRAASPSSKCCISSMCCCCGTRLHCGDGVTGAPGGHSAPLRNRDISQRCYIYPVECALIMVWRVHMAAWNSTTCSAFWHPLVGGWTYQHKGCQEWAEGSGPFH